MKHTPATPRPRDFLRGVTPKQSTTDAQLLAQHNAQALADAEITILKLKQALREMIADAAMQNDPSDQSNQTAQAIAKRIEKATSLLRSLGEDV
jgi:hypothetical protein